MYTLSTALKFALKFFRKRSFFDQNQQPLNNVEPFERILRALFIAQCPYKFSSFLDLRNGSSRFQDFRRFRFSFSGSAFFSKVPPPGNLQSWVKYYGKYKGKYESFGKEFRWTKFNAVERVNSIFYILYSTLFYSPFPRRWRRSQDQICSKKKSLDSPNISQNSNSEELFQSKTSNLVK